VKVLDGACRVFSPGEGEIFTQGSWTSRTLISRKTGARHTEKRHNQQMENCSACARWCAERVDL